MSLWNLLQQSQLSNHEKHTRELELRVARLEKELIETKASLKETLKIIEQNIDKDIDGDGKIG